MMYPPNIPPLNTPGGDPSSNGKIEYGRLLERIDNLVTALEKTMVRLDQYSERTDRELDILRMKEIESQRHLNALRRWAILNFAGTITAVAHAIGALLAGRPF